MRLILAAIFCSALLSDLLNMKRFALQGDTGRGNLPGAHRPPAPALPLYDPGGLGSPFSFQHPSAPVLCTSLKYGHWYHHRLLIEGAI